MVDETNNGAAPDYMQTWTVQVTLPVLHLDRTPACIDAYGALGHRGVQEASARTDG